MLFLTNQEKSKIFCTKNAIHRRGGKTVFAINHLIKAALTNTKPYPRYAFISPFRLQGKSTAWDYLKQFSSAVPGTKFNESELRVDFSVNNSRIQIIGGENSAAIRGQYFDGIVCDETQNLSPDLFDTILRPALSDRRGFAIFIGTPMGRNWFFELHEQAKHTKDWFTKVFKASETKIIAQEELDALKPPCRQRLMLKNLNVRFRQVFQVLTLAKQWKN